MDCSKIKPSQCSDAFVDMLKMEGLKVKADNETDTVNGYLSIESHDKLKHRLHIVIYDKDEAPSQKHLSTFKKPSKTFTLNELKKILE